MARKCSIGSPKGPYTVFAPSNHEGYRGLQRVIEGNRGLHKALTIGLLKSYQLPKSILTCLSLSYFTHLSYLSYLTYLARLLKS